MSNLLLARDERGEAIQVPSIRTNGFEGESTGGVHTLTSGAVSAAVIFTEPGAGNTGRIITVFAAASVWARFSNGVSAAVAPAPPSSNGSDFLIPANILVDIRVPAGADRLNIVQDTAAGRVVVMERV